MKLEEKVKMENLNISGKKKFPDSPNPKNWSSILKIGIDEQRCKNNSLDYTAEYLQP